MYHPFLSITKLTKKDTSSIS